MGFKLKETCLFLRDSQLKISEAVKLGLFDNFSVINQNVII